MGKKTTVIFLTFLLLEFAGCAKTGFNAENDINVMAREGGSGTRTAFVELFNIEAKGDDGSKKDLTTKEAVISKQTDIMMTNIAGDKYGIGYISLGSLNSAVKPLSINGIFPSAASIKGGSYPAYRPFYIVTKGAPAEPVKDFIDFMLSADGQAIVSQNYVSVNDRSAAYTGGKSRGRIVVAGSSSVTPVMEKLKEAYIALNPEIGIEIHQSDSSAGMNAVSNGTCNIGMASRELKESELKELIPVKIALDCIVIIINNSNPLTTLTKEQIKDIFTGKIGRWSDVN
ncbi:MAG: substrate-binding domain-containing protein [Leptospirales bacterium]|nr:substrate-binding domain-containing protein [Leptospirales bacterium]